MPLTYSIAYGLIAGICVWLICQSVFWILGFLGVERPSFDDEEDKVLDVTGKKVSEEEEDPDAKDATTREEGVPEAPSGEDPVAKKEDA